MSADQETPEVSIVIPVVSTTAYLQTTLRALGSQQGGVSAEILLVDRAGQARAALESTAVPSARVIEAPSTTTVPALRALGMAEARGRIIATLDDHCTPAPDWLERIARAHQGPHLAIGGSIENGATERLVDWAAFLCEYNQHFGPLPAAETDDLPGPNVSYKREALAELGDLLAEGRWETELHARLRERGHQLRRDPSIVVHHRQHFRTREFAAQRFHYGRSFAGRRLASQPPARRLIYGLATPLLPPLLLQRIGRRVLSRGRHRLLLLRSLPYLVIFLSSSALGELLGALAGPGDSLKKVT